jgi:hypothetical protein
MAHRDTHDVPAWFADPDAIGRMVLPGRMLRVVTTDKPGKRRTLPQIRSAVRDVRSVRPREAARDRTSERSSASSTTRMRAAALLTEITLEEGREAEMIRGILGKNLDSRSVVDVASWSSVSGVSARTR